MTRRRLLSASSRDALFEIPSDPASLERFYILAEDDLDPVTAHAPKLHGFSRSVGAFTAPRKGLVTRGAYPICCS